MVNDFSEIDFISFLFQTMSTHLFSNKPINEMFLACWTKYICLFLIMKKKICFLLVQEKQAFQTTPLTLQFKNKIEQKVKSLTPRSVF